MLPTQQDKRKELNFFDNFSQDQYDVFTDSANKKILETVLQLGQFSSHQLLLDLGCGSGVFTRKFYEKNLSIVGIDLSYKLIRHAKTQKNLPYVQGDVEKLPFADQSFDGLIFSCLLHHLPELKFCLQEAYRILKPGGKFIAFDPNRLNPFMYLYRDKTSIFYSSKGVTENERPVLPKQVRTLLIEHNFTKVQSHFVSGLSYRYIASALMRNFLPVYNQVDKWIFQLDFLKNFRAFVFTYGEKSN